MGLSEVVTKKVITAAGSVLGRGENRGGKLGLRVLRSPDRHFFFLWASRHAQEAVSDVGPGVQGSLGKEPQTSPRQPTV